MNKVDLQRQAQEWFERGQRDFETAQLLYDQGGYAEAIVYHIQQAIEKYLKGYLVLQGERPPRIHDLDILLSRVARYEPDLYEPYITLCERGTRYYLEDRYPPGPPMDYSPKDIRADLNLTSELIEALRA